MTIAIPVGLIVVIGHALVSATTAWLSRRNGSAATQREIHDCLKAAVVASERILGIVQLPGTDGQPLIYKSPSLENTNSTLDRIATRLERHMEIMEGRQCDARSDDQR
jgi:hypothetical protein